VLRRLGAADDADAVFARARAAAPRAFPWGADPSQMPCCGVLAPRALFADERGWRDGAASPVARALAAHAAAIAAEAAGLDARAFRSLEGHGVELVGGATGAALGPEQAPWRELVLFSSAGGWDAAACAALPTACRVLGALPDVVGSPTAVAVADGAGACCRVEVLRLEPNARVLPHAAPTNARLKAHVGLAGCDGASLTVAGERRPLRRGGVLTFDDSFWHEARNDGPEPRLVLSVDFWKPELAAR